MSIRHTVSIFCDECGNWLDADGQTTAERTKAGWEVSREGSHIMHRCPACTGANPRYWQ